MKKFIACVLFVLTFALVFSSTALADVIPSDHDHYVWTCSKIVNLDEFFDVVLIGYITGPMIDKYEAYQVESDKCLVGGYKFNTLKIYWTTRQKFESMDLENLKLESTKVPTGGSDIDGEPTYVTTYHPADLTVLTEENFPVGNYSVTKDNPLVKEETEYSIAKSGSELVVYKSKHTSEYNNGDPKKIETFSISGAIEEPEPVTIKEPESQVKKESEPKIIKEPEPKKLPPEDVSSALIAEEPVIEAVSPPEPVKKSLWQSIVCFFKGLFGKGC